MKNKLFTTLLLLAGPVFCHAQLGGLLNKVKSKTQQRVDNKVDKEIDKNLDKAEGKKITVQNSNVNAPVTVAINSDADNGVKSYSKFDFIPGEQILYAEDFSQDEMGELPLHWNTGGKAELVTLEGFAGKWLRLYQNAVYLPSNKQLFTKNFTAEFDLVLHMKNTGYMYPYFSFGFFASNDSTPNDNQFLTNYTLYQSTEFTFNLSANGGTNTTVQTSRDKQSFFKSAIQNLAALENYYGKQSHIAIQVQEARTRIWINGEKKFDLPMAGPVSYIFNNLFFKISGSNYKDNELGFYISNLKVATGKPDTRHKLIEEGRFSTTGILFDLQSAVIKPESYGVVKEIATVLKDNPGINVQVIGHTSSDGDDKANLELSVKRAAAVKELLVTEFAIDAARLETSGKGETQPVTDNTSKEGRSLNRRVEFVKH